MLRAGVPWAVEGHHRWFSAAGTESAEPGGWRRPALGQGTELENPGDFVEKQTYVAFVTQRLEVDFFFVKCSREYANLFDVLLDRAKLRFFRRGSCASFGCKKALFVW